MNLSTPALVLASLFTLPRARVQEAQEGPPVLSLNEIVLDQYAVKNVSAEDLYRLAESLAGREYYVKERGGVNADAVASLRLLGDSIVMYDTKTEVQRVKELLARLDAPRETTDPNREATEYRPHYLSLDTARAAIKNLVDRHEVLEERGLLVLEGSRADVEKALALLKRIDVPEKQVLLTCQLIEVTQTRQGPPLAKELADNLQKLLPEMPFSQTGMAMLKTSVGGGAQISMQIDSDVAGYTLSFDPVAFDEGSGSLTIANCSLVEQKNDRELFRTNTILRGGEYTVLAATGAEPKLLVVRVVPQG